jgi:hypothetical protein
MTLNFPDIHIYQFDTSEIASPSGNRHIEDGSFAFVRRVGLDCLTYSGAGTSGTLGFGEINVDLTNPKSHSESDVIALVFRLASSGVGISDMRLYLTDNTALTEPAADVGVPSAFVQMATSGNIWAHNPLLPSGAGTQLTTSIPSTNIRRQDGKIYLTGLQDRDVSEFVYMNLVVPIGFPVGIFGVCGSGLLRFNLLFDYWDSEQFIQFGEP